VVHCQGTDPGRQGLVRRAAAIVDFARRLGVNGTGQPKWTKEEITTLPPLIQILVGFPLRSADDG